MALTDEQISELKKQLSEQIKDLPEDQKAAAEKQISDLSPEALESMLEQQKSQNPGAGAQEPGEIYRAIIEGKIPSKKIEENPEAIAVLEIKPISSGHVIVIPKKQVKDPIELPTKVLSLAKSIAKRIKSKLKAKEVKTFTPLAFGEIIINLVPIYDKPLDLNSPRTESQDDELLDIQKKLYKKPTLEKIKLTKKPSNKKTIKLKRRIP
jgi:histidine triad (HIT) family protein